MSGWHPFSVPVELDARHFGLSAQMRGRACQFQKGKGKLFNVLSICTGLLPGAFAMALLGGPNQVGKAFAPFKVMKLFEAVEAGWAAARP